MKYIVCIKNYIIVLLKGFRFIFLNVNSVAKGQSPQYAILQESHRIEKGLCIRNPRKGWGYDKALNLVGLLEKEKSSPDSNETSLHIGRSVLSSYINEKKNIEPQEEKLNWLEEKIKIHNIQVNDIDNYGGTQEVKKDSMIWDMKTIDCFFNTRHSIRDFDDTPVDKEKIERAVERALKAPSACNRQASQVYVMSGDERIKCGAGNEFHADKYLIITGKMSAFSLFELNDWIVSSSIFCGYLTLALHAEGIGSCCMRKDIVFKSDYNNRVKKICNIPNDEQIILEMAIGNYKNISIVPISRRLNLNSILHFIDEERN